MDQLDPGSGNRHKKIIFNTPIIPNLVPMVFPVENGRPDVRSLLQFSKKKSLAGDNVAVADPGENPSPPPPLFLDQNEARRSGWPGALLYLKVWMRHWVATIPCLWFKVFSGDLCYGLVFFMWKGGIDHAALLSVYNIFNKIALAILDRSSTCNGSFSVYVICRIDQFRYIKTHTWLRGLGK